MPAPKILCNCGSNKPAVKCHFKPTETPPLTLQDALRRMKTLGGRESCLHPSPKDCRGKIVAAHSVQCSQLRNIAVENHVYGFSADPASLAKTQGRVQVKEFGVNNASTFTGFCAHHDAKIFLPIENGHDLQASAEHAFLLAYRAVAREYFAKRYQVGTLGILEDIGNSRTGTERKKFDDWFEPYAAGVNLGFNDLQLIKSRYDHCLQAADYSSVRAYVLQTYSPPDFLCSGAFFPECDFQGTQLQDLANLSRPDLITFSVLQNASGCVAYFVWLGEAEAARKLADSMSTLQPREQPDAIARLAFEHLENVFFSKHWWDNLPQTTQDLVQSRYECGARVNSPRESWVLEPDTVILVGWENFTETRINFEQPAVSTPVGDGLRLRVGLDAKTMHIYR